MSVAEHPRPRCQSRSREPRTRFTLPSLKSLQSRAAKIVPNTGTKKNDHASSSSRTRSASRVPFPDTAHAEEHTSELNVNAIDGLLGIYNRTKNSTKVRRQQYGDSFLSMTKDDADTAKLRPRAREEKHSPPGHKAKWRAISLSKSRSLITLRSAPTSPETTSASPTRKHASLFHSRSARDLKSTSAASSMSPRTPSTAASTPYPTTPMSPLSLSSPRVQCCSRPTHFPDPPPITITLAPNPRIRHVSLDAERTLNPGRLKPGPLRRGRSNEFAHGDWTLSLPDPSSLSARSAALNAAAAQRDAGLEDAEPKEDWTLGLPGGSIIQPGCPSVITHLPGGVPFPVQTAAASEERRDSNLTCIDREAEGTDEGEVDWDGATIGNRFSTWSAPSDEKEVGV
ncbi:hypothetical protein PLICRDRAFT_125617 [Plicaturopsis crispa FD-325 SS-3]|nr:hypothetical protein PLICRDRAFT_125617 [Plicaturopsis crispa FD-325 SS-3]